MNFGFRRCSELCASETSPHACDLEECSAAHIDANDNEWLLELLAKNHGTLRQLRLGIEHGLYASYAWRGILDPLDKDRFAISEDFLHSMNMHSDNRKMVTYPN